MNYAFLLLVVASSTFAKVPLRFDGFKVYRVTPQTTEQLEALHELEHASHCFNFWTDVSVLQHPVDIMVPPHLKYDFEDFLELQKLDHEESIENVQKLIDAESLSNKSGEFGWDNYHTLEEIYEWLDSLEVLYPGIVSKVVGGDTYEGRKILGVKISFKSGNKGVFLEGGIHAREWISPATVTYIANQLLTSNDTAVRAVAKVAIGMFFPLSIPMVTFTRALKTRKPYGLCYGADPNRNWGYHWRDKGAGVVPCMDGYSGSEAFSEIETKSLSNYISTIAESLDIYLSFHSYGQYLLIPFGHGSLEKPHNNEELIRIGKNATEALAVRYGTQYEVGNLPEVLYVASGLSTDWVLGNYRHIHLVYTFELRDKGPFGFVLPPRQIIPTGEETLDAVISMVQQADAEQ